MRGFTLLELLVVLFIITTVAFLAFPSLWSVTARDDTATMAATLKNLRHEAISARKEKVFIVDFKARQFRISRPTTEEKDAMKVIGMNDDETWEVFIPSRGTIKEGQVIVIFSPSVQEEIIALYLTKNGKESTITLNNLSGEVEIEEGHRKFDE
jgi:prepilin-type N-terminal cleavage/methylation domain-containing protein